VARWQGRRGLTSDLGVVEAAAQALREDGECPRQGVGGRVSLGQVVDGEGEKGGGGGIQWPEGVAAGPCSGRWERGW
jgi:hypothetical protein